jgi:hypothetical protein
MILKHGWFLSRIVPQHRKVSVKDGSCRGKFLIRKGLAKEDS